jgi:membrane protease subunit HflK
MAWNEPGNKGNNPWGGPSGSGGNDLQALLEKLGGFFGGGDNQDSHVGKLTLLALGGLLTLWGAFGVYQLDEQQRAVVLRLGAFHEIIGSGVHWNPPLIDTVIKENVTQQRSYSTQGAMLTEDENIVEVQLSVQYNIGDLKKFVLAIRTPEHALTEATDSVLRHAVGSTKMDDVLTTGRVKVATDVKSRLQQYLDTYQTGIVVATVNVEKTQPPSAVQASFDDVIKAREDEQRVQNEAQTYANTVVPEARGLVKRVNEEALAYHDRIISRAQGEANRFEALLVEYQKAPAVTRQRLYIDTMQDVMARNNKVMVDIEKGNNMLYLPVDQLRNGATQTSTLSGSNNIAAPAISQTDIDTITQRVEEKMRAQPQNNPIHGREGR